MKRLLLVPAAVPITWAAYKIGLFQALVLLAGMAIMFLLILVVPLAIIWPRLVIRRASLNAQGYKVSWWELDALKAVYRHFRGGEKSSVSEAPETYTGGAAERYDWTKHH